MRLIKAVLAVALLACAVPAAAQERITHFLSDVQVQPDGALDVTETIDVVAQNQRINHGIFRDFPTRYKGRHGSQVRVGFTLGAVTRDGKPEPAKVEPIRNGVRIRIGDAETIVPEGEHRYVLHYRTTRQIGRFKDFDELFWNATGNRWVFPIETAQARITLPKQVPFGQRAIYTGAQGSRQSNAMVASERPGEILFETTAPLQANEGLSVAVAFPKGIVGPESGEERTANWLADYGPLIVGVAGLLGLLGFYYVAWQRAGRDPRPGTIVPLFSPPDDLSPPAVRYIWKMGLDDRAFAAALVDAGVTGHVRISEEDGGWLSADKRRLTRFESTTPLPAPEEAMLGKLLSPGESIAMEQKNHTYFGAAKKALTEALKDAYQGKLFNLNWGWAFAGLAIWAAVMWLAAAAIVAATGVFDLLAVGVALGALLSTALLLLAVQTMEAVGKCLLVILAFAFGALGLALAMPIFFAALELGWWLPLVIPALGFAVVISGFFWMGAPTREGRAVLDRIMGFRQYLSITERERLDRMMPPDDTPELFERYLPYAIALGVENRWADRFKSVLAAAAVEGKQGFAWYSGGSSPWRDTSSFVSSVGSSLATTVSSASTAPGSSSGSGGGGSSGGGGGGGGGGGW
ncbi:DUF2207 domain-containing protein [Sphingomonas sinipercae]|uniref:DUF2207 domain-containing protein n=1 Tax=Sphingomonas sinipercae TaxID=2714944 RepID=A0A6G7ZNE5_9SPHN|nr:DUF2207 domain-containing protein [Sphingomonas sinipercae]QIL02517.1 DUF2207 domain-containing protein [Sphingomonas sinipercae]